MPNTRTARKRMRTSQESRDLNTIARTRVKTCRRTFFESVTAGDKKECEAAFKAYCSVLDRAARKNVIKKNAAARRKTRAAQKLASL